MGKKKKANGDKEDIEHYLITDAQQLGLYNPSGT